MRHFLTVLLALPLSAMAHVVFDNPAGEAGQTYRGVLRVSHGCDGSPTKQFSVIIPAGVQGAKPMPKAGWRIEIERVKLAVPYKSHGRTVEEDVSRITWTAKTPEDALPNDQFDEFVILAKLPKTPGKLYWKSTQLCESGRWDWHEVPSGAKDERLRSPASVLDVKGGAPGHDHHAH